MSPPKIVRSRSPDVGSVAGRPPLASVTRGDTQEASASRIERGARPRLHTKMHRSEQNMSLSQRPGRRCHHRQRSVAVSSTRGVARSTRLTPRRGWVSPSASPPREGSQRVRRSDAQRARGPKAPHPYPGVGGTVSSQPHDEPPDGERHPRTTRRCRRGPSTSSAPEGASSVSGACPVARRPRRASAPAPSRSKRPSHLSAPSTTRPATTMRGTPSRVRPFSAPNP